MSICSQWGRKLPVNFVHAGGRWWVYCKHQMKLHTIMGSRGQESWPTVSYVLSSFNLQKRKVLQGHDSIFFCFEMILPRVSWTPHLCISGKCDPPFSPPRACPPIPWSRTSAHHVKSSTFLAWTCLSFCLHICFTPSYLWIVIIASSCFHFVLPFIGGGCIF